MRVIAMAVALIVTYMWRRRAQSSPTTRPGKESLAVLAFAFLLVLWAQQVVFGWTWFWHRDLFEWLPLGACAVGAVIGYILADQQPASEQAAPASSSPLERLFQTSKALAANLALAALVLAALVPSRTWGDIVGRIQGVKAGGMELTLGAGRGADLARDIRDAAPPRPIGATGGAGLSERTGFVPVRLITMQSYTYPPKLDAASEAADEFEEPESYIRAGTGEPPASVQSLGKRQVRQVRRDRAIAWKMEKLQEGPKSALFGWFRSATAGNAPPWIRTLGRAQEDLLAGLAPHIQCLSTFVEQTKNRRLLEYENFKIVENLFVIAHLWSQAEKAYALAAITPSAEVEAVLHVSLAAKAARTDTVTPNAASPARREDVLTALSGRITKLSGQFTAFGDWATIILTDWTAPAEAVAARNTKETDAILKPCAGQLEFAEELKGFVADLASTGGAELRTGWFTPYLTVFAAQALSAMGDHASAIELLVQWMEDLDTIEKAERDAGWMKHQKIADWYRLQVLTTILALQRLSEGSDISIPQDTDGLRSLVKDYFPSVLTNMREPANIETWRQSVTPGCTMKEKEWVQSIVLSFATWIKQYLDVAASRASRQKGMSQEDLQFSALLEEINVKCFPPSLLGKPEDARFNQAEQHLQFVTTATAVRYHRLTLSDESQTSDEQRSLRRRTEASLRSAMLDLERAKGAPPGAARLRSLVYGSPGSDLLTNARDLQRRLEELPRDP